MIALALGGLFTWGVTEDWEGREIRHTLGGAIAIVALLVLLYILTL